MHFKIAKTQIQIDFFFFVYNAIITRLICYITSSRKREHSHLIRNLDHTISKAITSGEQHQREPWLGVFLFTSTSRLRATSVKFSCCSRVLSILSSVMQKHRSRASMGSRVFANMTNLAIYGTQMISLYS